MIFIILLLVIIIAIIAVFFSTYQTYQSVYKDCNGEKIAAVELSFDNFIDDYNQPNSYYDCHAHYVYKQTGYYRKVLIKFDFKDWCRYVQWDKELLKKRKQDNFNESLELRRKEFYEALESERKERERNENR